jgi:Ni/Co efflux regulator RcnB
MKKVMICVLALTFVMSMAAFAQQDSAAAQGSSAQTAAQTPADQAAAKAPLKTLKGTVRAEGDKVTFTDDKGKSWDVMNPEELKAHDGHHVQLSAHVYEDKNSIHVMSVKMLKGEAKSGDTMSK